MILFLAPSLQPAAAVEAVMMAPQKLAATVALVEAVAA